MSKQDFIKGQTCTLKVDIHCEGCKDKVKKKLQKIDGVYTVKIDSEQGKVAVTGNIDAATLIKKLAKSGKHAELWGGQKGSSNLNNQFKNMQIDGLKGGKDNKSQKGGGKEQKGNGEQQMFQQMQSVKGSKDQNFPKDKKAVKFKMPEDEFDDSDDDFDDEFDDEYDDDDFDDDSEDGFGGSAIKSTKKAAGSGGNGGGVGAKGANGMMNGGGLGNGKKGSGADKNNGMGGNNEGKNVNGGKNAKGGKQNQGGKSGDGMMGEGKNGSANGKGGGGKNNESGGKNGGGKVNGGGQQMMNNMQMGGKSMNKMPQMGNYPGGQMPQMGNYPRGQMGMAQTAQGIQPGPMMNPGLHQGIGQGNPYMNQQYMAQMMMMNQQQSYGNGMYPHPMMYARPPPMSMPGAMPHPASEDYAFMFSDENANSCSIM